MHLIIYFSGTGVTGDKDDGKMGQFQEVNGVSTISVRGCTHAEVCNSTLFPNLGEFAGRFVDTVFVTDSTGNLRLTNRKDDLNVGIRSDGTRVESDAEGKHLPITGITLCGTSRGGVTCFNVARELQKIAPNVKVDIVANQPVPGNISTAPGTTAGDIKDCTDLHNLQNVSVILGTYADDSFTKENIQAEIVKKIVIETYHQILAIENKIITKEKENSSKSKTAIADEAIQRRDAAYTLVKNLLEDLKRDGLADSVIEKMKKLETLSEKSGVEKSFKSSLYSIGLGITSFIASVANFVQKTFFSQIVPKLPKDVNQKMIAIPEISHVGGGKHLQLGVAESLHRHNLVNKNFVDSKKKVVREKYETSSKAFPINSAVQEVFGISQEGLYQYLDELHPQANRRRGYEFEADQSLTDWWNVQDQKASHSSTQMTKDLVKIIEHTEPNDKASLLKLYEACEKWLIKKSGGISSRYGQVTALRNEVFDKLMDQHNVPKKDLIEIKEKLHHEHKFLQKEWKSSSSYVSFFKTALTKDLDKAFEKHGEQPQSEANDRELLTAMDEWLGAKDRSMSKRYDLVLGMRNKLEESINIRYPKAAKEANADRPSINSR